VQLINNIKAIFAGVVFIVIATLLMQLLFILLAVAYNHVADNYSFLKEFKWIFRYLLGIPVFVGIMFLGGYITTYISKTKPIKSIINTAIVGLIVMTSMMWSALVNAELTITGAMISVSMIVIIILGGLFASKKLSSVH